MGRHQVQKEVDQHGDIVFVSERTNYKSILVKTFFILEYAVAHYDVRYIMKTDDDAFVSVPALLRQLHQLCESPDCRCPLLLHHQAACCPVLSGMQMHNVTAF